MKHISGKKMCRIVSRKGWIWTHSDGSHRYFSSPDGEKTTCVPFHTKDLRIKTQKGIMEDVGLTDEDL